MKGEKGEAAYIEKWSSWWWVVTSGNRALYFGPYGNKEDAEKYQEEPRKAPLVKF